MHEDQGCPWVLKTRSGEGMLVCREAASEGGVGERGGGRGSLWATGSRREVFEVKRYQGSRTGVVKE